MIQAKKYEKEQEEIKHIRDFIASCGTYANMQKQAKSKQKILDKMEAAGLAKPIESQVGPLPPFFTSCCTRYETVGGNRVLCDESA